ncbi:MAG: heparinase II/III-family protein, partial [Anaerolineae bacterium]|nr:heparinase II/III-family protein [Anaerolineae bacterium]
ETNWVLPAHENRPIDLFAAETAFLLAQTAALLGERLDAEILHRIYAEVDRRVLEPYLRWHDSMWWYWGSNNWNGVCNSSVAAAFLLLERDPRRVAEALAIAFRGLQRFLATAFESDGSSTEGVAYWHYGLINLVALSEMLRARTSAVLDPLASPRLRQIAAYPANMQLSGSVFAAFSDCDETTHFNFGIIQRLAERTGVSELRNLLARPAAPGLDWRLQMHLRNLLWWDGTQPDAAAIGDAVLTAPGIARLTGRTAAGAPLVVAIKAGHNAENHNQNDIASFVLHVDGENLLTDPGRGLYSRQYFGPQRYENIFANSYGHSVPRIAGQLQAPGREHYGELVVVETAADPKTVTVEFARAYAVKELQRATRTLAVHQDGTIYLTDAYEFAAALPVEEAFVTWAQVEVHGPTALIRGVGHELRMTIVEPVGARFAVELLDEACRANRREGVLKRLTFVVPPALKAQAHIKMEVA